jgi:type II secretory pathway component PulJ
MSPTVIALLATIGVVAFILLQAVQRAERRVAEVAENLRRAGERISTLEKEVAVLRKR